ncbi:MAG: hypothetical protein RI897_1491 [Verrucomicrobiota bacterium]
MGVVFLQAFSDEQSEDAGEDGPLTFGAVAEVLGQLLQRWSE